MGAILGGQVISRAVLMFDDLDHHSKYSTLRCLWLNPGIAEDLDFDLVSERYSGWFGIALSPRLVSTQGRYMYGLDLCSPLWVLERNLLSRKNLDSQLYNVLRLADLVQNWAGSKSFHLR